MSDVKFTIHALRFTLFQHRTDSGCGDLAEGMHWSEGNRQGQVKAGLGSSILQDL
jgi:hypothetical protein